MDPSIMKLLEEDEVPPLSLSLSGKVKSLIVVVIQFVLQDETMHSGADVEAFTAALNRDIEGDNNTSTSQPSDSDTGKIFLAFHINQINR